MGVRAYDSVTDLWEAMQRDRQAADGQIEPWQRLVRPGQYVVRLTEMCGDPLLIYAKVLDPVEEERRHYDLTDPLEEAEFEFAARHYGPLWQESYVFGRWYSQMCREGEYGQAHRCTLTAVITPVEFEHARELGWPMDQLTVMRAVRRRGQN